MFDFSSKFVIVGAALFIVASFADLIFHLGLGLSLEAAAISVIVLVTAFLIRIGGLALIHFIRRYVS